MAGRKPLPTVVKQIKGTLQRCRTRPSEAKPVAALGKPAAYMTDSAKEAWKHATKHAPPGLLTALDMSVVERWANAAGMYRDTLAIINQKGMGAVLMKAPNGMLMQSPLMSVVKEQGAIMDACAAEMGFTPSARTRISVPAAGSRCHDGWEDIAG
jgi:P27 family predicted phage terminase small subunit